MSIARYSFIQLSVLEKFCVKKAWDSNPGFLSQEYVYLCWGTGIQSRNVTKYIYFVTLQS